jgi:hypothetical protein
MNTEDQPPVSRAHLKALMKTQQNLDTRLWIIRTNLNFVEDCIEDVKKELNFLHNSKASVYYDCVVCKKKTTVKLGSPQLTASMCKGCFTISVEGLK